MAKNQNSGVETLGDLLRSAPMRATTDAVAGGTITVQAKTTAGLTTLVAVAENDIRALQEVKLVSLDDGIITDAFTGVSQVVRHVLVRGV